MMTVDKVLLVISLTRLRAQSRLPARIDPSSP
ncbi:hypothetical protein CORC01_13881 [Colletotrichum orchidophilum]|uniref:Uncharacterized protein n=1 Tax=Colletotrichum orchidophilum TaxID=1209926 RepID=A0A1G4ANS2_9PEZI|nr:uncharacterized protein CORC01_13881 [Colletotrichum orchidophilum]OHE90807.1 hypothetical protein CORC01_13881 [Colletotrichum orchidophilum]